MGKGKQQTPTDQTVTQTSIPQEFMPYFERLMGRVESQSNQPYQAYGGARIAPSGNFADITRSQGAVRGIAGQGIAGLPAAQANAAGNIAKANQLGQYDTGQFTQYGGFQAGQAQPFAGFQQTQASPFAGFQAGQASPFADFQAGRADQYTGFQQTQAKPFAEFQAGQAQPFAEFSQAGYNQYGFGPSGQFTGSAVSQYMDPYMQNVVDVEKRRAQEDYDIARQGRSSRAVQAGAFGGSRAAVQEGLAERDLLERQGGIQARGLSDAYAGAQGMFEADRAARMSTEQAQAAEAARVQSGTAGEAARVQQARAAELARTQGIGIEEAARVQQARAAELARSQGISVEEAARVQQAQAGELARTQGIGIEESARVQQARAAELARTQGISIEEASRIQAAQAGELGRVQGATQQENARVQQAQAEELARTQGISIDEARRIQAAQAGELGRVQTGIEASRQFGAGQGIAGIEASQAAGTQLVGLGEKEREAQIQNAQLLDALGRTQQAETQAGLDIGYQDYLRQQGYPTEQLAFLSNTMQGLPVQAAGTTTATGYGYTNPLQQAAGAGLAGLSLYKAYA